MAKIYIVKIRTWIHSVALLPTVVSCAGWKWVNPSVGSARYCDANADKRDITTDRERRRYVRAWRMNMRSALLHTRPIRTDIKMLEHYSLCHVTWSRSQANYSGDNLDICNWKKRTNTNWIILAAAGATSPKVCTCAITSCRRFFSSWAAISNCAGVRNYISCIGRIVLVGEINDWLS